MVNIKLFSLDFSALESHFMKIYLCFEHCQHVNLVQHLGFWLTNVNHLLRELLIVEQADRKALSAKHMKKNCQIQPSCFADV